LFDALDIHVCARDVVTEVRKADAGRESDVTATNDSDSTRHQQRTSCGVLGTTPTVVMVVDADGSAGTLVVVVVGRLVIVVVVANGTVGPGEERTPCQSAPTTTLTSVSIK
jgi:hypothetical protein